MSSTAEDKSKDIPQPQDDTIRHNLEHDKVSFVSEDQDDGVTRIEALCDYSFPL